jgi:hypothetical protein
MDDLEKKYKDIFGDTPPYFYYNLEDEQWGELIEKCIKTKKSAHDYLRDKNPNEEGFLI